MGDANVPFNKLNRKFTAIYSIFHHVVKLFHMVHLDLELLPEVEENWIIFRAREEHWAPASSRTARTWFTPDGLSFLVCYGQ